MGHRGNLLPRCPSLLVLLFVATAFLHSPNINVIGGWQTRACCARTDERERSPGAPAPPSAPFCLQPGVPSLFPAPSKGLHAEYGPRLQDSPPGEPAADMGLRPNHDGLYLLRNVALLVPEGQVGGRRRHRHCVLVGGRHDLEGQRPLLLGGWFQGGSDVLSLRLSRSR